MSILSENEQFSFKKNTLPLLAVGIVIFIIGTVLVNAYRVNNQSLDQRSKAAELSGVNYEFTKIVDAVGGTKPIHWAYAPSIIKENGRYHLFFCSRGGTVDGDQASAWDYTRYVTSTDGVNWTAPVVKLRARPFNGRDFAACDPSIVKFQGPTDSQPYYYMYYTSAHKTGAQPNDFQSVIQVARSETIDGAYKVYTDQGTWETEPRNPKRVILPLVARTATDPNAAQATYGAGQQTVLVKNGELNMWYTDDSKDPTWQMRQYYMKSRNPVLWDTSTATEVTALGTRFSNDVKYDAVRDRFIMISVDPQHTDHSKVYVSSSTNGLNWVPFTLVIDNPAFPIYSHNSGLVSGPEGHIVDRDHALFAFGGAPDIRNPGLSWGRWNLYGTFFNIDLLPIAQVVPTVAPTAAPSPTPKQIQEAPQASIGVRVRLRNASQRMSITRARLLQLRSGQYQVVDSLYPGKELANNGEMNLVFPNYRCTVGEPPNYMVDVNVRYPSGSGNVYVRSLTGLECESMETVDFNGATMITPTVTIAPPTPTFTPAPTSTPPPTPTPTFPALRVATQVRNRGTTSMKVLQARLILVDGNRQVSTLVPNVVVLPGGNQDLNFTYLCKVGQQFRIDVIYQFAPYNNKTQSVRTVSTACNEFTFITLTQ